MGKKSPRPPAMPNPILQAQAEAQVNRLNQIFPGGGSIVYSSLQEKINQQKPKE